MSGESARLRREYADGLRREAAELRRDFPNDADSLRAAAGMARLADQADAGVEVLVRVQYDDAGILHPADRGAPGVDLILGGDL